MNRNNLFFLTLIVWLSGAAVAHAAPTFRELAKNMADQAGTASAVAGVDGWWFFKEDLQHLAAGNFWGEAAGQVSRSKDKNLADPLPAIVEYHQLLTARGITLYLLPVPPKALVYPEKLGPGGDRSSTVAEVALYRDFYAALAAAGVKVIDLLPTLLEQRDKAQLYCRTDTHYSGVGLALFAKAAAEAVKKESWHKDYPAKVFKKNSQKVAIRGDLLLMAGQEGPAEDLELTVVTKPEDGAFLASDEKSPVILLGDSHTLVFQAGGDLYAKGAGLFDHLSAELGFAVDLLGVRGSGVTPARIKLYQRAKQDPSTLTGKKALIWCFAAREFTGSGGWRKVPVAP